MATTPKRLLRLAAAIGAQLATHVGQEPLFDLPLGYWQQAVEIVRQIRRAQLRGWHKAEVRKFYRDCFEERFDRTGLNGGFVACGVIIDDAAGNESIHSPCRTPILFLSSYDTLTV